jgi:hypothetical protein
MKVLCFLGVSRADTRMFLTFLSASQFRLARGAIRRRQYPASALACLGLIRDPSMCLKYHPDGTISRWSSSGLCINSKRRRRSVISYATRIAHGKASVSLGHVRIRGECLSHTKTPYAYESSAPKNSLCLSPLSTK